MSARIRLAPAAEAQFLALPGPVQNYVLAALMRLAQDPGGVMRESKRLLGVATLYRFTEAVYDGQEHTFSVPFRLYADGAEVQILAIAASPP